VGVLLEKPGIYSRPFISLISERLEVFRAQYLQICKEVTKLLLYGSKTTTQRAKKEKEKGWGERDQNKHQF
jgi:hypothetical protein